MARRPTRSGLTFAHAAVENGLGEHLEHGSQTARTETACLGTRHAFPVRAEVEPLLFVAQTSPDDRRPAT